MDVNSYMDVKSLCRVCNNFVSASLFRLHHDYKQMVCPTCFSGKTKQKEEQERELKQQEIKAAKILKYIMDH